MDGSGKMTDRQEREAQLRRAYVAIYTGGELTGAMWSAAQSCIRLLAWNAVERSAAKYKIPRRTIAELADNVEAEITEKLVGKKPGDPDTIRNFEGFMRSLAFRATISVLRRIKSPLAGQMASEPGCEAPRLPGPAQNEDVFLRIRSLLGPFRFQEYGLVRDALLAVRLATGGYPGPGLLRWMVQESERTACYNAAVYDINSAIAGFSDVGDASEAA